MINQQIETCLPPNANPSTHTQKGYLRITPLSVTFFNSQNSKYLLKIQFWGSSQPNYLQVSTTQTFPIVSNLTKFKLYLIDSKVASLEVVDSRNYKTIGVAYLNWILYLRSIQDKLLYRDQKENEVQRESGFYLPFIDETMEDVLPLYRSTGSAKHKSNQKLGQLKLKWECRIFDIMESRSPTPPQFDSEQNLYNIRVGHVSKQSKFVSINEIDVVQEDNASNYNTYYDNPRRVSKMTENNNNSILLGYDPKKINPSPSNKQARISSFSKVSKMSKISRDEGNRGRLQSGFKHVDSNLDTELVRIRMQMDEYTPEEDQRPAENILKIQSFQSSSRQLNQKQIAYLDVLTEKNQQKSKCRVFPQNTNNSQAIFNSSLAIGEKTTLTFILGLKKGKDIQVKGQVQFETIGDTKQISMFGSDGIIYGFLKVTISSPKKQILNLTEMRNNIQTEVKNEKNEPLNLFPQSQLLKPRPKEMPRPVLQSRPQLYYLLLLQEPNEIVDSLSYEAFGRKIEGPTAKKFAIFSQKQILGKSLAVQIFNSNQLLIHSEKVLDKMKESSENSQNLTCSLILRKILELSKINCSLYSGSVDQLVFFVQELTRNILTEIKTSFNPKQYYQEYNAERISTQGRQNTEEGIPKTKTEEGTKKLKTEEAVGREFKDRRMTEEREGQSQSGHEIDIRMPQEHEIEPEKQTLQQNENFYLVDLLTRFLQEIQNRPLPEGTQIQKPAFLAAFAKEKESDLQEEVVEMILSIFQDEAGAPVNLDLVRKSSKAFQTFVNLYTEQKTAVLKQILTLENRAIEKIRNNAEMSMINQKILWGKALNKVTKSDIRQKINKFYRISSFGPTEALLLIEDLENVASANSEALKLKSIDVCNLGSLIKEWVQQFLVSISVEAIKKVKDKVIELADQNSALLNIRSTNEVLESELGLRLSLWESLMLIQEIKSAYICDIDVGEGLISGDSLATWIESVINRQFHNQSMQQSKVSQMVRELQGWNKGHMDHKLENRSVQSRVGSKFDDSVVYKNNDSEIVDIANLLRLREEEQQKKMKISSLNPDKVIESEKEIVALGEKNIKKDILNEDIPESTNRGKKVLDQPSRKPNFRLFYIQVNEIFFFQKTKPSQSQLKFTITLGQDLSHNQTTSFLYLTSFLNFTEANQKSFEIKTRIYKNQTIYLRLFSQRDIIGSAVLDWEEYTSWYSKSQEKMKKTLMIYGRKGALLGKICLSLLKSDPSKEEKEGQVVNTGKIKLKVIQVIPFSIEILHLQYTTGQSKQYLDLAIGGQYEIQLENPIYSRELLIENINKDGSCLILLEELYLKKYIKAQYPLIDVLTGTFKGNLTIQMAMQGQPLGQIQPEEESLELLKKKELKSAEKNKTQQKLKRQSVGDRLLHLKDNDLMKQIDTLYDSLRARYGEVPRRDQSS